MKASMRKAEAGVVVLVEQGCADGHHPCPKNVPSMQALQAASPAPGDFDSLVDLVVESSLRYAASLQVDIWWRWGAYR